MQPHDAVDRALARHGATPPRLLAILRSVQADTGCVPAEAFGRIAAGTGLTRAEVESTASFYRLLHTQPRGAVEVLFSDNIVDHMAGKPERMRQLCDRLGVEPGVAAPERLAFVDSTSDIGLADQPPGALVNGRLVPALDAGRLEQVAGLILARQPLEAWPAALFDVPDHVRVGGPLLAERFEPGAGLRRAQALDADGVLAELEAAGLRGRGGAGFRTAVKWGAARRAAGRRRSVICNADEGEPGTFKDRVLLNSHADLVFEGMSIAAHAIGATEGFVYLRGEYLCLLEGLNATLERRRAQGLLGNGFDIDVVVGAGAYVCGEESALIESLEGKPGRPRNRPPYPDTAGFEGRPSMVNNVETFACAAKIMERGSAWFAGLGTPQSTGTKVFCVSGDCDRPGLYELPFGVPIRQLLAESGAHDAQAVQAGGPSGTCLAWRDFDRRLAFEDVATAGALMVFSRHRDLFEVARNFTRFFADESCGFCTPCRVGTSLLRDGMDKLAHGKGSALDLERMKALMHVMQSMSHCGLGHTAARPVVQVMQAFPESFERRLRNLDYEPAFDLDAALADARRITGRDDAWAHLAGRAP